jgi:hypothetical protein
MKKIELDGEMNERIQELMKQCTEQVYDSRTGSADKLNAEKFAELIVAECMDVVTRKCASPTAYNALVEHFGVEE